MFAWAGVGVAMGNGSPAEDGAAVAIERCSPHRSRVRARRKM